MQAGKVFIAFLVDTWRAAVALFSAKRQAAGTSEGCNKATQAAHGVFPDRRSNQLGRAYTTFSTILDASACFSRDDAILRQQALSPKTCQQHERGCSNSLHPRALICRHALGLACACTRPTICRRRQRHRSSHSLSVPIWTSTTAWILQPVTTTRGPRSAAPRLPSPPLLHRPTIKTCRRIPLWPMWLSLLLPNRRS
jgi:hypothetical protein